VTSAFVHLRIHSEYSLSDGIVRIDELIKTARDMNMPAVAITDLANMFGAVKFSQAAAKAGIKPILGCDLWVDNSSDRNKPYRLLLLCQNRTGYQNLCALLSRAYSDGQHNGRPCIHADWLAGRTAGLIAIAGGSESEVGQALLSGNQEFAAQSSLTLSQELPGRLYR